MTKDERLLFGDRIFAIRDRFGLTQADFAERFGLSVWAVKSWEEGRYDPINAARLLIRMIELDPDLAMKAATIEAKLGCTVAGEA
jgi:DNA-binding transcriptional regulator YiaG